MSERQLYADFDIDFEKKHKSESEVHFLGLPTDCTKYSWYLDSLFIWDV